MLVFTTRIWMSRNMAEENESSGGSRYSLSGFMKLEALVIAGATLLLYLQGLLYVEAFCAGLGITRELFNLTFSEVVLHAWVHLMSQGIIYGTALIAVLFGFPVLLTVVDLVITLIAQRRRRNRKASDKKPESREEKRLAQKLDRQWDQLGAVVIALAVVLGLFIHSGKRSIASAEKAGKARLENKQVSTVTLTNGSKQELVYLARLGETYAFIQPGSDQPRRFVMMPRSEIAKMEFAASQPTAKEEAKVPAVSP